MIFWIFKLISDFCLELYLLVCMSCTFQYVWVSHCWFLPWGCLTQACVSQVCAAENPRFLQCSLACMSALRGHESANTSSHTPKERSPCKDLCSKGFSREAGYINGRCIMPSAHPEWPAQVCLCLSRSWKGDAFSQLFKMDERKLYSANKLLTLNDSLSSMAQSLLPQFSALHMKQHKISFLSSKPFLIENCWDCWSQN